MDREKGAKNLQIQTKPKPSRKKFTFLWSIFTNFDKKWMFKAQIGNFWTTYCDFEPLLKIAVSNILVVESWEKKFGKLWKNWGNCGKIADPPACLVHHRHHRQCHPQTPKILSPAKPGHEEAWPIPSLRAKPNKFEKSPGLVIKLSHIISNVTSDGTLSHHLSTVGV